MEKKIKMRKFYLSIIVCLFCSLVTHAQDVVISNYTLSYFNESYDIEASEIKDGKFAVYIQVRAKRESTRAMIGIESDKLEEFKQSLVQMKEKFEKWSKVAKDNNVTDMSKEMGIEFPSTTFCWLGSKWFYSYRQKVNPEFRILDNGNHVALFVKKVKSSSNEYIDETFYWVFSNSEEFDELISKLDYEKIKSELEKKESASDLFK